MRSYRDSQYDNSMKILTGVILAAAGLAAGLLISRIFIFPYIVRGDSMHPNYSEGQRLLCYRFGTPVFGDVVIVNDPVSGSAVFARRVAGVPGDSIEIKNRVVYRNSVKLVFPWKTRIKDPRNFPMGFTNRDNMPLIKLHREEFFLLNDNIDDSYDSRTFGKVNDSSLRGVMVYSFK